MSAIQFRTLGTLDLRAADGRELHSLLAQPKRIALLAYLCIAQPRGYTVRKARTMLRRVSNSATFAPACGGIGKVVATNKTFIDI